MAKLKNPQLKNLKSKSTLGGLEEKLPKKMLDSVLGADAPAKPASHHDLFFKAFYTEPQFAKELLTLVLHKEELLAYNLNNIKIEKNTLKEKQADVVFSLPLKAKPKTKVKIFILLEHKSHYDSGLFNQLLTYQFMLYCQISKESGPPCPIIPVVFYHGKKPWKWPKTFQEDIYKGFLRKIPLQSREHMLNYKIKLLDTHDPKIEKAIKDKSFKSRGALYLLKNIWGIKLSKRELKETARLFGGFSAQRQDLIANASGYLSSFLREEKKFQKLWTKVEKELIEEGVFNKGGSMSILKHIGEVEHTKGLQKGIRKGLNEGLQKGQHKRNKEIIHNMLKEKLDINLVSKVMGLPVKEIKKLQTSSVK